MRSRRPGIVKNVVATVNPSQCPTTPLNHLRKLAPGQTRSVTAEGEKLFVERKGKKEELNKEKQLFPETSDLFFRKGVEGRILFHYDATGKVESLIDRRICLKFTRRRRAIRPVTSHSATQLPPCFPRSSLCILPCYALRICWIRFSAI